MIAVSYQQAISIGDWERWVLFKVRSDLHASVEFEKLSAKHADFAGYSTRVEDDRRPTYQPNLQSILKSRKQESKRARRQENKKTRKGEETKAKQVRM